MAHHASHLIRTIEDCGRARMEWWSTRDRECVYVIMDMVVDDASFLSSRPYWGFLFFFLLLILGFVSYCGVGSWMIIMV